MSLAALVFFAAAALSDMEPSASGPPKPVPNAPPDQRIVIEFGGATNNRHKAIHDTLEKNPEFEAVVSAVNEVLILTSSVKVGFQECATPHIPYNAQTGNVTICYEDIAADTPPEPGMTLEETEQDTLNASLFYFLHGLGNALIDQLHIPIVGSPVEASDGFATVITLLAGDALSASAMQGMASYALDAAALDPRRDHLANEPLIDETRAQQVACLVYGSDPQHFGALVGPGALTGDRARGCEAEFNAKLLSWSQLLEPHLRQ